MSVPFGAVLPDRFSLHFPLRDTSCNVLVKWRGEGEIGVAFLEHDASLVDGAELADPSEPPPLDVAERLHRLETEVVELRSVIAELCTCLRHYTADKSSR